MRGMGRTFQRGSLYWISYYCKGCDQHPGRAGEHRESSESEKERAAIRLLKRRLGEIQTKKFVGPQEEKVTFEELVTAYLQDYTVRGLRSQDTAEARVTHLRRFFGPDRARAITPTRLRTYQAARLEEGAQAGTVNRELAALARMFHLAVKADRLSGSPTFPERLEENAPRQGFFEHAEYLAILEHLAPDYQDVLDFAYYSGWRKREITELTWPEVDLPGGGVRLSPERSKTKVGRVLPLSPPLTEVLARRASQRRLDTRRVFHKGGQPIGDWRKAWARACKAAGFWQEWRDETGQLHGEPTKTLHDCRRTTARNLIRAGVPERVAMVMIGHKTRSIFDRYNIVSDTDLKQAGARLAEYVAGQPTTPVVIPIRKAGQA